MTINVYDHTNSKWPERVFNMPEANAARDGGNEITVRGNIYRTGIDIIISNDEFSVDITHKTADMLIEALLNNKEAEYALLESIRDRLRWGSVKYPKKWQSLGEEITFWLT